MQVIFVRSSNNEICLQCILLTRVNIALSLTVVIFFFPKSNLDNALHLGNYNGDVSLQHAYLLVQFLILFHYFSFACKFQVSLPFLSHVTIINMLMYCNNAFYTTNEVKQSNE